MITFSTKSMMSLLSSRASVCSRRLVSFIETTVEVECCRDLYKKWTELKPHLPKPKKSELRISMELLRTPTGKKRNSRRLTVLALHGSPGSAEHFRSLGNTLCENAPIDLIAPSFPDISYTLRTGEYFHSAEEKAEIAEAICQKLGFNEIDLVIGHSAGSYPATIMTLNQKKIRVKSLALICTPTSKLIPAFGRPWLHSRFLKAVHVPGLKRIVVPAYSFVQKSLKLHKMQPIEVATALMSAYSTLHWHPGKADHWYRTLIERAVPRMAFYSSRDFVVPTILSEAFAGEFGNPNKQNHFIYEGKNESQLTLVNTPVDNDLPPIVNFINGGHNPMQQFPKTVAGHLLKFCESVVSTK